MNERSQQIPQLIDDSLEWLAERVGDPGPDLYRALFEAAPELPDLFVLDTDGSVRGEMLYRAFETLRDLAADKNFAADALGLEVRNHLGYGVPIARFALFFDLIADACLRAAGSDWTAAHAWAWQTLRARVDAVVAEAVAVHGG
ncbi:MAG: globin [Burkholderiaceae bacterium]